ncbi:hypothetical protein [Nannocystis sp.]|uniref:hypothetical protein n=1 Tax=Nannocystis sp. TaxID=1962667 RepID=UPI0024292251|nr:hypothetical protein [Nannocystis sp.]MBK7828987.1 hypothetical protein [Nannocystis sp.]MBK9757619.1 hypothetical protein [Nannocystis sp.]
MLLLTVMTIGCGRPGVETRSPELSGRAEDAEVAAENMAVAAEDPEVAVEDTAVAADDAVRAGGAAQTISFADDADPEPTTQVQAAPKRPPIPRFRLFGTREQDGPN